MHVGSLTLDEFIELATIGFCIKLGPFTIHLVSDSEYFLTTFHKCYATLPVVAGERVSHYRIAILRKNRMAALGRSQVEFFSDGERPFDPYPAAHAFLMFEWGLNWCIATTAHQYLLFHSATAARGDDAIIFPAMPGSGKSTLCTSLVGMGWRLLSDEFGVFDMKSGALVPMPRAIPLKNESIAFVRNRFPNLTQGPTFENTRKGTVSHVFPPDKSIGEQSRLARPRAIVFPRYTAESELKLSHVEPHIVMTRLVNNAFNYLVTGESGFTAATSLVNSLPSYRLEFSDTDAAIESIAELIGE